MLHRTGLCSGDPHPGNHLRLADGRVGFFDFGLMRKVEPAYLERERALARAATDSDAESVHAILAELGYLPDPATFSADTLLDQLQGAGEWWMVPGTARLSPAYVAEVIETTSSPRSPHFESMRRMSLPAQALLVRRMEGLVFTTLGELRAHADWHGIGREIVFEAAPATALGELDATFWRGSGR